MSFVNRGEKEKGSCCWVGIMLRNVEGSLSDRN